MINIDNKRNLLLSDFALKTLEKGYSLPDESPQGTFKRAAQAFSSNEAHAQRIYDYASKHWFMFSSPILSNAGKSDGLPISCYLNHVDDSRRGILGHYTENGWLSSNGGGIGANWSSLRSDGSRTSKGGRSTGLIPFLKVSDSQTLAFSQGTSRRGSYAAYLDISHPEIEEFISIRKSSGGDLRRKCQDIDHGVNIPDEFMRAVRDDGEWNLIDPNSGRIKKNVKARFLWELILQTRMETGEPYLHFIDASNRAMAPFQLAKGLYIHHSNLCTEILLPTSSERTAICCLSSVNLTYYDVWKNTDMVGDIVEFLDNVLTFFEQNAPDQFEKAKESVRQERAIGLGVMGFHDLLQQRNIAFEDHSASKLNEEVFSTISSYALIKSAELGVERGFAPESEVRRNTYLMAVAPNATSGIICGGTSPGIEPYVANIYTEKTNAGTNPGKRNRNLEALNILTENDWDSVLNNKGSVQHLTCLDDQHKAIYKTAREIDQMDIIKLASQRQVYIDQGQSVNLFFKYDVSKEYIAKVHYEAWKQGLKTLYYVRGETKKHVENIQEVVEIKCIGCDG